MKTNNVSFPYPVLGHNDDVNAVCKFKTDPVLTSDAECYIVHVETDVHNHDIVKYVRDKKAVYVCEVECQRTLLRKCFSFCTGNFEFRLRKDMVAGTITFFVGIVAVAPIDGYSNKRFHEDYAGFSFDLEPGDLMAIMPKFSYDADIKYDRLKQIGSIIQISEGHDLNFPKTVMGGDKIDIKLPTELYKIYRDDLSNDQNYSHVIHSSLVYNSLFQALISYEDNKDTLWARTIQYRVENELSLQKYADKLGSMEIDEIAELAQTILLNPYKRLFETLKSLNESDIIE
ncbi:MAG: hypothetical protein K2I89_05510 [Muribaculaceae bacterium]|nr:hypothetical protein [Muribaculaceae bacterium]